ncbi:MAG TPA: hypothetical protein VF753_16490 [Terriglobales bacterium]
MKKHWENIFALVLIAVVGGVALGQSTMQTRNVTINGQSGKADVIDQNGRLFADVMGLASIGQGSVSFHGTGIVINFPAGGGTGSVAAAGPPVPVPPPANSSALSQQFMIAGIEEVARLREWATTLASAIRGNYGVTDEWVNGYRDQASQSLQLADAAATTDGDRNAAQLLHNGFNLVQQWSDQLVAAKKNMDTAQYTSSPNALRNDPLSQKLITCGHFLTRMLGGGKFQDDGSCN